MEQTIVTLLIAVGGAVFGVLVIAGGYLAARAALRDANGILRKVPTPEPNLYASRPEAPRRSGAKPERLDPIRVQQAMILELQRTRSILLGWLSVLEAFALGDAWRATALRSELGDINTCDVSLVGDANVIATYQLTVDMLRNQAGRGLPPDVASQMASIRVRLLTALAEQERRLNHGERPQIAEPLGHLDLWGPPRPITEVIIRPAAEAPPRPALAGGSDSSSSTSSSEHLPSYPPAAQPLVIRSVAPSAPTPPTSGGESNRLIAATTAGAAEVRVLIPPTSKSSPPPETSRSVVDPPATGPGRTAKPTRPSTARTRPASDSAPKSSAAKSSELKSGAPEASGLKASRPAPRNPAKVTTAQPAQEPRSETPTAGPPVRKQPAAAEPGLAKPTSTSSRVRPILRALPDPTGPTRAVSRPTTTTGTTTPVPLQAGPAKPATAPTAATKPVGAQASKRPTSALAKPGAPAPRRPASSASGPIGPAAMSAKPAVRSTARRSVP